MIMRIIECGGGYQTAVKLHRRVAETADWPIESVGMRPDGQPDGQPEIPSNDWNIPVVSHVVT